MTRNVSNLLTDPTGHRAQLPLIAPSILSADVLGDLARQAGEALQAGAGLLHLDVMDGHFVPNLSMGPEVCASLRRALPGAFLDVHLMVSNPTMFVEPFILAGANHITFHVEAVTPDHARWLADHVRGLGASAGIAINPPTPVERIAPLAECADMLLVMSVNPGFSGQCFMPETLEKTRKLRLLAGTRQRIEMDGGIGLANCASVRDAGCDVIVAATAIFGVAPEKRAGVIRGLRGE